eukprot:g61623.t1
MQLGPTLCVIANVIRVIASGEHFRFHYRSEARSCIMFAQVVNAFAAPLYLVTPPKLSIKWFPFERRTTVTAVAAMADPSGLALAFVVPKFFNRFHHMLVYELYSSIAVFGLALIFFFVPDHPAVAPSSENALEEAMDETLDRNQDPSCETRSILRQCAVVLKDCRFVIVALVLGLANGFWTGWIPYIPQIAHRKYGESDADIVSSIANLATIAGGLVVAPFADRYCQGRIKALIVALGVSSLAFGCSFLLDFATPYSLDLGVGKKYPFWMLLAITWGTGFSQGALVPVSYELCSEMSFPAEESIGSTVYISCSYLSQGVFTFMPFMLPVIYYNSLMNLAMLLCIVGVVAIKIVYRRHEYRQYKNANA